MLAIISDIHDNLVNLEKCSLWCSENNIQKLICCGDITNSETLEFIANKFSEIFLIRGNMDIFENEEIKKYKNINFFGRIGRFKEKLKGKYIGLCHEPFFIKKVKELGECDFIFYGHTHKPWEETDGKTKLINPGTLGGVFQKATFAVYNPSNSKLELKILELLYLL